MERNIFGNHGNIMGNSIPLCEEKYVQLVYIATLDIWLGKFAAQNKEKKI